MTHSSGSSGGTSSLYAAVGAMSDSSAPRDVSTTSDSYQPSPAKQNIKAGKFSTIGVDSRGGGSGPASAFGGSAASALSAKDPKPGSSMGGVMDEASAQVRSRSLTGRSWSREPLRCDVFGGSATSTYPKVAAGARPPNSRDRESPRVRA